MNKTETPQISKALLKPLMELDTIKKGTTIYLVNDQKKVHWQLTAYTIQGTTEKGLIVKDKDNKICLLPNKTLDSIFIYQGHA